MGLFSTIGSFLGGPVGGAIGSLGDTALSNSHNNASIGRAGADRIAGYDAGIDALKGGLTDIRSILQPYMTNGGSAVNQLGSLLGLGGDSAGAIAGLKDSPVFKALMQNGQDTILGNASATGGLRGGNVENSLGHLGTDTLAQVYQMMISNLGNLSQLGAQTGLGFGGLEENNVGQQAQAQVGRGNAAATMVLDKIGLGADNKSGTGANNTSGSFDLGNILQNIGQIFGGGSGGGSSFWQSGGAPF
jgi:hypothetical protein